jgi:hypothetical protein
MFTRQTLRRLANDNSFRRGEASYDDGSVTKLRRENDGFRATVRGSRSYHVALRLAASGPDFVCNCPYEFDGICKHAVALGLAVLDAYGTSLAGPEPATRPAARTPATADSLPDAVRAAWARREPADKLRFLEQALAKSADLARQFLAFDSPPAAAASSDSLATLPNRLTETLEVLEFDEEFWENSGAYDADDEGETLAEAVAEALREVLAPFVAELLALARGGQLAAALRYWATACAAIYQVEEPARDDYGSFGDYGTDVLHQWHADLAAASWPAVLLTAVLPPAELSATLAWLGQYLAQPPAEWPDFEASWQPLLLALAADTSTAPLLPATLAHARLSPDVRARLALQTAQTQPDPDAWRAAAETLLSTDAAVARQLLDFYATRTDEPARLRAATTAFTTWPDQFSDYVLTTFTAAQAPDLYRVALRHRALANASLADFERLRPLLAPAALAAFVREAASAARAGRGSVAFATELLVRTADAPALRDFVLGLDWLNVAPTQHLETALRRLAEADPTPLMLALETRTRAYLQGRAKRGHTLYAQIGRWLAIAHGAGPRLVEPALRLALELRQEFPTLYGLRDALSAENLLPATAPEPKPKAATGRRGR